MPFQKGRSGNPAKRFSREHQPANPGRPKKLPELQAIVSEALGESEDNLQTVAQRIVKKLAEMALNGNLRAAELLLNYAYGKPTQQIDHTTEGVGFRPPATIIFTDFSE